MLLLTNPKKMAFLATLVFLAGFFVFQYFQNQNPVQASSSDNVSGWAWSENIGWLSFNCNNPELPTPRCVAPNNYGVNLDSVTGNFSGYAWSENIGWIDFAPVGPYPSSPSYSAKVDLTTGEFSGWARALAFGGGWDGWIKLKKDPADAGAAYGVSVDTVTGDVSGFTWGSDVIGWVKFKNGLYGVKINPAALNRPPNKPGIPIGYPANGVLWNSCSSQAISAPNFNWTYSDPNNDDQAGYQIQIDDQISFLSPILLDDTAGFASLSYQPSNAWISANLNWNTAYYWRVKVKDSQNNWSIWSDVYSFTTPVHAYPWPGFTFSPAKPKQGESVNFQDQTTFYDSGVGHIWNWDFGDGGSSVLQNPSYSFNSLGNYCVRLRATDSDGFSCQTSACPPSLPLNIGSPAPKWKEVAPF